MGLQSGRYSVPLALCAVFALGIGVRWMAISDLGGGEDYLAWSLQNYFGGITSFYLELADGILEGRYTVIAYPPGYPALLALMNLVGIEHPASIRIAQAILDSLGVFLAYWLLRKAGAGSVIALAGALSYAVFPLWVAGSVFVLAEFATPLLMMGSLAVLLWSGRSSARPRDRVVAGACIGIAALVRPDLMLLPALLGAWLVLASGSLRRASAGVALLVLGFSLPISGWGLYNKVQHGEWVFSSTSGGSALYQGLGKIPNPYGYVTNDLATQAMLRERGMDWLSIDADRYLKAQYLRAWREHPQHVLKVIQVRWAQMLTESESWFREVRSATTLKALLDAGGAAMALACLVLFRRRPTAILITAVPVLYALGSLGLTHWEPRYARYMTLACLFSLLLLLQALASAIASRSHGRWWGLAGQLSPTLVLLAALAMAVEVTYALGQRISATHRQSAMVSAEKGGAVLPAFDLCQVRFVKQPPESASAALACQTMIETAAAASAYHLTYSLQVPPGTALRLSAAGTLESGGFVFGILSGDGSRWIGISRQSTVGAFSDSVTGDSGGLDNVIVVLANNNPSGDRSRFLLTRLEIQCFPAACRSESSRAGSKAPEAVVADALPAKYERTGIDSARPLFQDPAVRAYGPDTVTVDGPAATRFSYLLRLPEGSVAPGTGDAGKVRAYLVVEGNLEQGGFTAGLLRAEQWFQPVNVTHPGPFRVVFAVREPGLYSPLIANNVTAAGNLNRFTITTLRWVLAE